MSMILISSDDSRSGYSPQSGPGQDGVPVELAPGHAAAEAGAPVPAGRGSVPGCVEPGTVAPLPADPSMGSGAAISPPSAACFSRAAAEGGTRTGRAR